MIPTALEKDAFPALASALTFESKSTQKSTFSRKERSDDCFYSVQGGVPQTAPSYELSRKYPRYCGSPKMNIFKIRNETMIATTPHQAGPADRLLIIISIFKGTKWFSHTLIITLFPHRPLNFRSTQNQPKMCNFKEDNGQHYLL